MKKLVLVGLLGLGVLSTITGTPVAGIQEIIITDEQPETQEAYDSCENCNKIITLCCDIFRDFAQCHNNDTASNRKEVFSDNKTWVCNSCNQKVGCYVIGVENTSGTFTFDDGTTWNIIDQTVKKQGSSAITNKENVLRSIARLFSFSFSLKISGYAWTATKLASALVGAAVLIGIFTK